MKKRHFALRTSFCWLALSLFLISCGLVEIVEDEDFFDWTPAPLSGFSEEELPSDYLPTVLAKIQAQPIPAGQLPVGAVVQIVVSGTVEGTLQEWSGSGTIISSDGLILTNAHVAMGDRFYPAEELLIMLTVAEDQPPEAAFYAEVVQADQELDIAVLRPAFDLFGDAINTSSLNLPYAALGDSDALHLGDDIAILGYPGIGGETITLTRGEVSGFTSEATYGKRAFIKTSATIAGGNSGGLAINRENALVGIPTQVGAGEELGEVVDCRPLADTNRDGYINQYDTCVPTGGFINALRPIKLAMPLIEAARSGQVAYQQEALPVMQMPVTAKVIYQDDFSDSESGWPTGENFREAYYYQNGKYWIEIKPSQHYRPVTRGSNLENIILQIDARVERSSSDGEFGVVCRFQDENNMYYFVITQDGYYAIYKYMDAEWYPLIEYTQSAQLANKRETTVTASCIGNTLSLAVDGRLLGEAQDSSFSEGQYGIFAGTYNNGNSIVSFDNLIVSQP